MEEVYTYFVSKSNLFMFLQLYDNAVSYRNLYVNSLLDMVVSFPYYFHIISESFSRLLMNQLSSSKRTQVIAGLVEGNSIRATVRMTGASKNAIQRLLAALGPACERYPNRVLRPFQTDPLPAQP